MKTLLLTLATVSLITSSLGVAHAATEATLDLSGTVEPFLAISFTPTAAASALDLASFDAVKVADMNIESNSATGYKVSFADLYGGMLRNENTWDEVSLNGDYIAYSVNIGGLVVIGNVAGADINNLYQDTNGAAVNASFDVNFISAGKMFTPPANSTNPNQLVAGTYTNSITATIAVNE